MRESMNANHHRLNIAAFIEQTGALGPGQRAGIWVQGCPFHCVGCISPEWQAFEIAQWVTPEDLAKRILNISALDGLTISGGEPMLQAAALTKLIKLIRRQREINVICFTGYSRHQLSSLRDASIANFLAEIDVLIDGPYVDGLNDGRGLRGSSNQGVHYLSSRLLGYDFETHSRSMEIQIRDGEIFLVGIPDKNTLEAVDQVHHQIRGMEANELLRSHTGKGMQATR